MLIPGKSMMKRRLISKIRNYWIRKRVSKIRKFETDDYKPHPVTSAIIQVFNKASNIQAILTKLVESPLDEIIFIDDGSVDGTWEKVLPILKQKNHFLVRSNDIFEVRTYDRALHFARGAFAVLLQDDDIPTNLTAWVNQALELFSKDPRLLILGGRDGLEILLPDPVQPEENAFYTQEGDLAGKPGMNKYRLIPQPQYWWDEIPFQYTMSINRSPMWIRREPFLQEVGIDQIFAPFQCDDVDSCLRAWKRGWRVGLYTSGFQKINSSGMRLFNPERLQIQATQNWAIIYQRYQDVITNHDLQNLVDLANQELNTKRL
jgi:glycosyltransferase involved in cell wall biosynthesis